MGVRVRGMGESEGEREGEGEVYNVVAMMCNLLVLLGQV